MISVVVPVYNVDKYLMECVNSLKNQTYSDLEIILVDDGSTDESGRICDELAKEDQRILVIHQTNAGLGAARNSGFRVSKGEYVCFVDSDDYVAPNYCEKLLEAIERNDADIAVCYENAFDDGQTPVVAAPPILKERIEDYRQFLEHFEDDFRGPFSWAWNKMFRRELVNQKQFQDGKLEDIRYMFDIAQYVKRAVWIPYRLYYYRQRESSIMHTEPIDVSLQYVRALRHEYNVVKSYEEDMALNSRHGAMIIRIMHQIYKEMLPYRDKAFMTETRRQVRYLLEDIDKSSIPMKTVIKCFCIYFRMCLHN